MLAELIQRDSRAEEDSLLRLYWNRAGVKRELAKLKREHFELLDKLEQQEGAIMRAQNQLEGLERLLTDPLAAANAMVYFQLRHLWRVAALKVQQFGKELKHQREKREKSQMHNTVLAKRGRRLQAIEEKLGELVEKRKHAIEECKRLEQQFDAMNVVVKLVTGRALRNRLSGEIQNRETLEDRIEEFNEIIEKIQGEPLPDPDGLSLESRRLVNVAIIALGQHLVVHFDDHDLAVQAKKAARRTVADMKFGDRRTCDQLVERIRGRIDELERDKGLADRVKQRSDLLVNEIGYRHESDAVPMRSGLNEILIAPEHGRASGQSPIPVNVLEDDYWDLSQVLY